MKSSVCKIDGTSSKRELAIKEAENFANSCQLQKKQMLHILLLSEELLGMAFNVLEVENGLFWIEKESMTFKIYLKAEAEIGDSAKKRLLAAATTGEDEIHKGVSGKILKAYEWLIGENVIGAITPEELIDGMVSAQSQQEWSLMMLKKNMQRDEKAQSWDELEKSVLGKLADDVRIGLSAKKLKIVVTKCL